MRRCACLYRLTPTEMLNHLGGSGMTQDEKALCEGVAAAQAATPSQVRSGPYCPLCFARDLHKGILPSFRRSWQNPWSTHCDVDQSPLFLWPIKDSSGALTYPAWVREAHFKGRPCASKSNDTNRLRLHLQAVRRLRRQMAEGSILALCWRQQIEHETVLESPEHAPTFALFGVSPTRVRRVVGDLAILLGNEFGSSQRAHASQLAGFLGPPWMFSGSFSSGRPLRRHSTCSLASFTDPAQRRTLISAAMRIALSFAADPEFARDARLVGAGQTTLSGDLRNCPEQAKAWAQARASAWPDIVSVGVRSALRCAFEPIAR